MKTEFTPEEEALIPVFYQKYMDQQTEQQSFEDIQKIVNMIWKDMEFESPEVIVLDSTEHVEKRVQIHQILTRIGDCGLFLMQQLMTLQKLLGLA
jgi:hypothetical protein